MTQAQDPYNTSTISEVTLGNLYNTVSYIHIYTCMCTLCKFYSHVRRYMCYRANREPNMHSIGIGMCSRWSIYLTISFSFMLEDSKIQAAVLRLAWDRANDRVSLLVPFILFFFFFLFFVLLHKYMHFVRFWKKTWMKITIYKNIVNNPCNFMSCDTSTSLYNKCIEF